jgi:hypothetical protein
VADGGVMMGDYWQLAANCSNRVVKSPARAIALRQFSGTPPNPSQRNPCRPANVEDFPPRRPQFAVAPAHEPLSHAPKEPMTIAQLLSGTD